MFLRLVQAKAKTDEMQNLRMWYQGDVVPALQEVPGCLYACLMQSGHHPNDIVSMTFWQDHEHALAYEQSGLYHQLLDKARPMLAESSEWKIQLSRDMKLEYAPVPEEPVVKSLSVTAASGKDITEQMYLRLVSMKIRPGMMDEVGRVYQKEIIPGLLSAPGCRHAFLATPGGEGNEAISVTIWNSKEAANEYEQSGLFKHLVGKLSHTFTELFQWKMQLESGRAEKTTTSEDLKVEGFNVVVGKRF